MSITTVHIGSDHAGLELKNILKARLEALGIAVHDHGTMTSESTDYPIYAHAVCRAVLAAGNDTSTCGILVCGTGLGMSMAANRHRGIRAALCTCEFHARASREHNNANVLCLGARITGASLAEAIMQVFLETPFAGGRHARRVSMIEL